MERRACLHSVPSKAGMETGLPELFWKHFTWLPVTLSKCWSFCRRKGSKKAAKGVDLPHSTDRFVPYRVGLPPVPEWDDVEEHEQPLAALEELDMEEEFLQWASYVFRDGST